MQFDPAEQRLKIDPAQVRRVTKTGRIVLIILLVMAAILTCVGPYADYLWYAHDARQPAVFETSYGTRASLLLIAFFVTWGVLYWNVRKALRVSLIFLNAPENRSQAMLSNAVDWITRRGSMVVLVAAPILAFIMATGLSGEWNTFLLSRHVETFGKVDPIYGLDLGFYVFSLPWYRAVSNYVFGLSLLTTLISIGVFSGLQAMAALAKIELSRPHIRSHVSTLVGITILAYALQTWLKTYEYGLVDSGQFTGAGYAAMYQLNLQRIFVWLAAIVGLGTIVGQRVGKPYSIPITGAICLLAYNVLLMEGVPFLVQRFVVGPDRLRKEAPYAAKAIDMTRYGYALNKIGDRDWEIHDVPTATDVASSKLALDNMRLWDPDILRQALESTQSIKPYYTFNDVDIDRYTIEGKQTMLMLSPRDLRLDGLDQSAQNWVNERLRYTHGYGLTVSRVDQVSSDGQPVFLASNMPLDASAELPITQPRLYFNDVLNYDGSPTSQYTIVNTGEKEFDFPGSPGYNWTGDRGVPISGLLSRLAFAIYLGDFNLLISQNVTGDSRLLMRRNVAERATKTYPFLKFDTDPYIVIVGGRIVWLLDGYTTSSMIPYSEKLEGNGMSLNYIRNSVKVTVDAYTGETTAYAIDPNEPILKAYREIYPGLVHDLKDLPPGIREHFRYPEDLFLDQCRLLQNYHVTDPLVFLSNSDAWDIAKERGLTGGEAAIRPYYVQLQIDGEKTPQFQLILPFTPQGKPNMAGWLSAQCDGDRYGEMTLYRFGNPLPKGPELKEADFSSTPEISYINRQYRNDQSDIIVGNSLVIPIGHSVMYSESLFLVSKTTGIQAVPRLFRVILALKDKVVIGESYQAALNQLLGGESPTVASSPSTSGLNGPPSVAVPGAVTYNAATNATAKQALDLFDQASKALKGGDFAKYGQLQGKLRDVLAKLATKP